MVRKFTKVLAPDSARYPGLVNMLLELLKNGDGDAPGLNEQVIDDGLDEIAQSGGSFLCPQINATYLGLKKLIEKDWIGESEIIPGTNVAI